MLRAPQVLPTLIIRMNDLRIVLGNASVASYPSGGGHFTWFVQYPLGLRALGIDVFWLELLFSRGDRLEDERCAKIFLERMAQFGLTDACGLLIYESTSPEDATLEKGREY